MTPAHRAALVRALRQLAAEMSMEDKPLSFEQLRDWVLTRMEEVRRRAGNQEVRP